MDRVTLRHLSGARAPAIETFPLDTFVTITLGRDPAATVRFDLVHDGLVSRAHARIVRMGEGELRFLLQDLNARNGTFVNRRRVRHEWPLSAGDVVQLGAGGPELGFAVFLQPTPTCSVRSRARCSRP
jgi:hypothetical protein